VSLNSWFGVKTSYFEIEKLNDFASYYITVLKGLMFC